MKAYTKQVTKYYKWGDPNVTLVGSPTVSGTNINGFSKSNYANIPIGFSPSNRSWEFVIGLSVSGSTSAIQTIAVVCVSGTSKAGFHLGVESSKFRFTLRATESQVICDGTKGTHTIATNTVYYVKVAFNGSQYTLDYSTDKGKTYIRDITVSSTSTVASGTPFSIGENPVYTTPATMAIINLKDAYLKYDNSVVWTGLKQVAGTSSDHDFTKLQDIYYAMKQNDKYYTYKGV